MSAKAPDLKLAGLSVWVLSRQFPDDDDYWDGNWLNVRARVEASGSVVEARGSFVRADELTAFAEQLEALQRNLIGDAELTCMEPNLGVKLSCGTLGHIEAVIHITPDHLTQCHQFTFEIDQSYLPPILRDCKRILERLPVVGAPPKA